jgi:hypothetical protein
VDAKLIILIFFNATADAVDLTDVGEYFPCDYHSAGLARYVCHFIDTFERDHMNALAGF